MVKPSTTFLLTTLLAGAMTALAQAPSTDVLLVPLPGGAEDVTTVAADDVIYLTDNDTYDNQPSFTPDGSAVLYVAEDASGQTDIYRYELASGKATQVTDTKASEFSPQVTPDGEHISAVRIEADEVIQRLWQFDLEGENAEARPKDIYRVGYYAFAEPETLAFVIVAETESGEPLSLEVAGVDAVTTEKVAEPVGVGVQRVPNEAAVSFIQRNEDGSSSLSVYDLESGETRVLTETLPEVDAHTFLPGGAVLAAQDTIIYRWQEGQNTWKPYLDFSEAGVTGIGRLAVSSDGNQLAFVINKDTE